MTNIPARFGRTGTKIHLAEAVEVEGRFGRKEWRLVNSMPLCGSYTRPGSGWPNALRGNGGDEQWRGGWYPLTLIRDSYFEDYARELAEDIHGHALRDAQWPFTCIDWTTAANDLLMDYGTVEYDGVTYWYR